jgi:hypothetical protein
MVVPEVTPVPESVDPDVIVPVTSDAVRVVSAITPVNEAVAPAPDPVTTYESAVLYLLNTKNSTATTTKTSKILLNIFVSTLMFII